MRAARGALALGAAVAALAIAPRPAQGQRAPRALEARLAALDLGANAAAIRVALTSVEGVRPASVEVLPMSPTNVSVVGWDHVVRAPPAPWDLRTVRLFAPEGSADLSEYFQRLGADPDSDGAIPNRIEGALAVEGDPRRGVGLVRAGAVVRALVGVRAGALVHAEAQCSEPGLRVVRTVCGLGVVCRDHAYLLDASTLRERGDGCARGFAELLREASAVDATMSAAEHALEALTPDRRGTAPGAPLPGPRVTCARPAVDGPAVLRLVAALRTPRAPRRPRAEQLRVEPSDFGCVHPRTGAFLVRVRAGSGQDGVDALVAVSRGGARLAAGWSGDEARIATWFEVDLDGDGAAESVIDLRHGNEVTADLRVYRSDGTRSRLARALTETSDPVRPAFDPAGHALMIAHELYRLRGGALVRANDAQLPVLAAALDARRRALFAAPERLAALRAAVYAEASGAGDGPLPRAHPARVAWEAATAAALERRGVPAAQARALVAFDPLVASGPHAAASQR